MRKNVQMNIVARIWKGEDYLRLANVASEAIVHCLKGTGKISGFAFGFCPPISLIQITAPHELMNDNFHTL